VLDLKPDWLSIMIGTNDVWRQFDAADRPEIHVLPQEYETTLNNLVTQTRPTLKGLVLMTPFFIEPDMSDPMRIRMDQYGAIVRKIATGSDVLFVDTQAAFDAAMKHHKPAHLADDRVHPTLTGHMVLAKAFLKAVRFAG
jgi:lysophospholipase L1-like esterase